MVWEMSVECTLKNGIVDVEKFVLKRNKSVKFNIIPENTNDDYDEKTVYKVKMSSEKTVEELEICKKNDNKITKLNINSKIIKIKDSSIVDDVFHASFNLSEQEEGTNKYELPWGGSFTTLVDGLQYRYSEKLFREIEELAEAGELGEVIDIVDRLITQLQQFVLQKAEFIQNKMSKCRQAGCDECIRVP